VGYPKGSEIAFSSVISGPRALSSADLFFRHMVFHDPCWDFRTLNYSDNLAAARVFSPLFDAVDTDLSAFKNLGGKLLHYHNWGSSSHAAGQSIKYYEDVVAEMGKDTEHFYRLFMVPGGDGSKAPRTFDPVPIMEQWVEKHEAPDKIIAYHLTATGEVDRTRPLCPYPKVARYKGTGSTDDAANFRCVDPEEDHDGDYDRWGWKEWRNCGKSKEHSH
jgi:Tannase and feruloyl esterase